MINSKFLKQASQLTTMSLNYLRWAEGPEIFSQPFLNTADSTGHPHSFQEEEAIF